jgi:hypothetical protein
VHDCEREVVALSVKALAVITSTCIEKAEVVIELVLPRANEMKDALLLTLPID